MAQIPELALAEAAVARLRTQAEPDALADALLTLSRAYEQSDRTEDAFFAVRDGFETLAPLFLASPPARMQPMRAIVAQYLLLAGRARQPTNGALLGEVAAALGGLMQAEDTAAEDE
jgi:hypothetical protein